MSEISCFTSHATIFQVYICDGTSRLVMVHNPAHDLFSIGNIFCVLCPICPNSLVVWVTTCNYTLHAGKLKKKLDLRLGSQRHRHFVGFFNMPDQAPTRGQPFYVNFIPINRPISVAFYYAHRDTEDFHRVPMGCFRVNTTVFFCIKMVKVVFWLLHVHVRFLLLTGTVLATQNTAEIYVDIHAMPKIS